MHCDIDQEPHSSIHHLGFQVVWVKTADLLNDVESSANV
jgi:hypothetical protein